MVERTALSSSDGSQSPRPDKHHPASLAFATQSVSLQTFPAGRYELEVTVRDRLTRRSASGTVSFSVAVK